MIVALLLILYKGATRVLGDQPDIPKSLLRIYPNIGLNEHRLQGIFIYSIYSTSPYSYSFVIFSFSIARTNVK